MADPRSDSGGPASSTLPWDGEEASARRLHELTLLLDTARALTSSLELREVIDEVLHSAARMISHGRLSGPRTSMIQIEGESWTVMAEYDELDFSLAGRAFSVAAHPGLLRAIDTLRACSLRPDAMEPELTRLTKLARVVEAAYVPIQVGTRLFGVLTVEARDHHALGGSDLRLLEGIADLAGMAIGNAERVSHERSEDLASYHEITSRMVSSLDVDETLTAILKGVAEMVGADIGAIFLADEPTGVLRVRKSYGHRLPEWESLELPLGRGLNAAAIRSGEVQQVDDYWDLPREARIQNHLVRTEPVHSVVVAPLIHRGRRLGALGAYRRTVDPFDDRAVFVLGLLADHAGIALDHAITYAELAGARQRLENLLANTEAIWRPMPFDETARLAAQQAANMLPGVQVLVAIVPPDNQRSFRLVAGIGPLAKDVVGDQVPFESNLAAHCIAEMRTIETTAVHEPGQPGSQGAERGIETARLIPLTTDQPLPDGRTALGVLGFYRSGRHPFSPEDRELMDEFGKRVSLALHRAELLEAAQTTAERLQIGIEVAVELAATLDLGEITQRVLRRAVTAVQAGRGALLRIEGDYTVLDDYFDVLGLEDVPGYRHPIAQQPLMRKAIVTRQPVAGGPYDTQGLTNTLREVLGDVLHTATIPLLLDGQVAAVLILSRRTERPFGPGDLAILQLIGNQAVLALRNARLFIQAQEASRAKSDFLNLAAHELRTPLSVISGYLSMFQDGSLGPAPEAWLQPMATLSSKASELAQLIDDLLLAARLEAGPVQFSSQAVDARLAAADAIGRGRPRAELLGAQVSQSLPDQPVMVAADPEHLGRILDNLINNALSYSLGHPWIQVEVFGGAQPKILVEDRGRGIAPDLREQIFERFVRIEDPLGHPQPGTGLGLYISRDLAQRMGGSLELEWSEPGHGSLFVLGLRTFLPEG